MARTKQTARKSRTKIKVEDNVTLPSSTASQPPRSSVGKTSNQARRDTIRRPRSQTPSDSESEGEGIEPQATGPPHKRQRVLADAPSASASKTPHIRRVDVVERLKATATVGLASPKSQIGENQSPSPSSTDDDELATGGEDGDEAQTSAQESCDSDCSSSTSEQEELRPLIEIEAEDDIHSVAFLADGKDVVGCGKKKKIRRWHVEDGKEVGIPLDVAEIASIMVVSQDGKWICETIAGKVRVWNAESYEKVIEFDRTWASAMAISPDAMKIVTGSDDFSANIWSLSTGERLLGPLQHDSLLHRVKFSPDGRLFAAAARSINSIRIYDSQGGHLLGDFPAQLPCVFANQSIAWTSDSKHLFVLAHDAKIYHLDVHSGSMGNHWIIHSTIDPTSISLSNDGTFIAASAGSSTSFWDTTTYKQIEGTIEHPAPVKCMAISSNYDLVTCDGGTKISLWDLCDVLPSPYSDNISDIRKRMADTQSSKTAQSEYMYDHNVKNTVEELRNQLVDSQSVVKNTEDGLNETIESLRTDLCSLKVNSADLEETVKEHVDHQLFDFQLKTDDLILQLRTRLSNAQRKTDNLAKVLLIDQQKWRCEFLYADGQVIDAALSLLDIVKKEREDVFADWLPVFRNKCVGRLGRLGDEAAMTGKSDEALAAYSAALSLGTSSLNDLLIKWVRTMLILSSPNNVRDAATKLKLPRFNIHRAICNVLEEDDRAAEAVEYFQEVQGELVADENIHNVQARWELEFQRRCVQKLEKRAADAMESQKYREATEHYTAVLSLDTADRVDALIKRCKAQAMMTSWEDALNDAQEAMKVKESLLRQGAEQDDEDSLRRHAEAAEAFETLLRKLLK